MPAPLTSSLCWIHFFWGRAGEWNLSTSAVWSVRERPMLVQVVVMMLWPRYKGDYQLSVMAEITVVGCECIFLSHIHSIHLSRNCSPGSFQLSPLVCAIGPANSSSALVTHFFSFPPRKKLKECDCPTSPALSGYLVLWKELQCPAAGLQLSHL